MKWQEYEVIYTVASFLLLLISLVMVTRRKLAGLAAAFLKLYFLAFFLATFISYLVNYKYALSIPHVFRTGHIFTVLIMPFSYFYVLQNLYPRKLRYLDLLHLLPAVVYVVDYFPILIMSGDQKIQLMKSLNVQQLRVSFQEGWFMPTYGHVLIRYIAAAIYFVAQILLLRRAERTPEHPVMFENPAIIQWMKILVATGSFFFLLPLVSAPFIDIRTVGVVTTVAGVIVSLLQGYYLFFRPEVLYGIHEYSRSSVLESSGESIAVEEKVDYYTDEILKKVEEVLEDYMQTAKPYLKSGYKVSDLAQETGLSVHSISAFCNRRRKVNFFGYLNRYRIDHCLNKFALGEHEHKTLEALAEECGFNNRGTFIRVFKSIIGQNPTEYLSSQQKSVRL